MSSYGINLTIDAEGLQYIYDNDLYVTVVRDAQANRPAGDLPVAWLAFQPLENNQVTWGESYYLYATTTPLESGAIISMTSQTAQAVQLGWTYTFAQGRFTGAAGTGSTFNASNQTSGVGLGFGLAQAAAVNNAPTFSPLNAIPVLFNEIAAFTPDETVTIFLSRYSTPGTVMSEIPSNALTFDLSSRSPNATLGFNDATHRFYLISGGSSAVASPFHFAQSLARRAA